MKPLTSNGSSFRDGAPISGLPEIGTCMSKSAKADLEWAPGPESMTTVLGYRFRARGLKPAPRNDGSSCQSQTASYSAATRCSARIGLSTIGLPASATMAWPGGTTFQCARSPSSGSETTTTLPPDSR